MNIQRGSARPLSLCLVFYALVLTDGFAVFHGHLGLVRAHFFALSGMVKPKATLHLESCLSRPVRFEEHESLTVLG